MKKIKLAILMLMVVGCCSAQYPAYMHQFKVFTDTTELVEHVALNGAVVLLRGFASETDGNTAFWTWDSTSLAIPNASTILDVIGVEPGRWVKLGIGGSTPTVIDTTFDLDGSVLLLTVPHGQTSSPSSIEVRVDNEAGITTFVQPYWDGTNVYIPYSIGPICLCEYLILITP